MRALPVLCAAVNFGLAASLHPADVPSPSPSTADLEKEKERKHEIVQLSAFVVEAGAGIGYYAGGLTGSFGAKPGGFQDLNFGRELLAWGLLPRPEEITAEGLFSEFDLPAPPAPRSPGSWLAITGAAKAAGILNHPEVTHLVQIGFASTLDPRTWRRDPLDLVVVADVSGSMAGKLALLQETLRTVSEKLGPDDTVALVAFANTATVALAPVAVTPENRPAIAGAIAGLTSHGGTSLEAGLRAGFRVAERDPLAATRRRRVLLVTDAMPNIDATDPESFMALAEQASLGGTGLTTIGVGLDFSAGFVRQLSSISGGNAFYFSDAAEMRARLGEDFDFMVTELAFDVQVRLEPAPGVQFREVYGLPGDVFERTADGALEMDLPTLFLSRERGGIFVSATCAAPASGATGARLGRARLSYVRRGGAAPEHSAFDLVVEDDDRAGAGLRRGELLVNEFEALRAAGAAFYEAGDLATARVQTEAVWRLFAAEHDRALRAESSGLAHAAAFLAQAEEDPALDGRALRARPEVSPLLGVWRFDDAESTGAPAEFLLLLPGGRAGLVEAAGDDAMQVLRWKGGRLEGESGEEVAATLSVVRNQFRYRSLAAGAGATEWNLTRARPADIWGGTGSGR